MVKKYYAIKEGRKTGVFSDWEECKKYIDGYSGSVYKSFSNYEDAEDFLGKKKEDQLVVKQSLKEKVANKKENKVVKTVEAYVDGSYSNDYKVYAYGCIILQKDKNIELSGNGKDEEYLSMRNVAGEILGSMKAIEWASEAGYDEIVIYYDYEGIEKWARGLWKANKKGTKEYVEFIEQYSKSINIQFHKVEAHSGNFYNEQADKLAKKGLTNIDKQSTKIKTANKKQQVTKVNDKDNKSFSKKLEIFNEIMYNEASNNSNFKIVKGNLILSEDAIKKFVREIWTLEGKKKTNIKKIKIEVDVEGNRVYWTITDKEDQTTEEFIDF